MHEHIQCEHEVKYCKVCDVCYCEKCKKQWYVYNITYIPNTQTWVGDGTYPYTVTLSHTHGKELE